jgi:hypothetical protein
MVSIPLRIHRKAMIASHRKCRTCGYDLHGLGSERSFEYVRTHGWRVVIAITRVICPECGRMQRWRSLA